MSIVIIKCINILLFILLVSDIGNASDSDCDSSTPESYVETESSFQKCIGKLQSSTFTTLLNDNITKLEDILCMMTFASKHCLSWVAIDDLIAMMDSIFGCTIVNSKFVFRNVISKLVGSVSFHMFCLNCDSYITTKKGKLSMKKLTELCPECSHPNSIADGYFFMTFPMENQIKYLLEANHQHLLFEDCRQEKSYLTDIVDGKLYKKIRK